MSLNLQGFLSIKTERKVARPMQRFTIAIPEMRLRSGEAGRTEDR